MHTPLQKHPLEKIHMVQIISIMLMIQILDNKSSPRNPDISIEMIQEIKAQVTKCKAQQLIKHVLHFVVTPMSI